MSQIHKNTIIFLIGILPRILFASNQLEDVERKLDRTYITTPNGTCGAYTALARPILNNCNECCGSNWFAEASLLYWSAFSDENNYAYKRKINDKKSLVLPRVKAQEKDVAFDWNWGFKVNLGYNMEHDGWETNVSYMNFCTKGSGKVCAGNNEVVVITLPSVQSLDDNTEAAFSLLFCEKATSNKNLNIHTLQWGLERNFFVSDCLSLRPSMAIEAAWYDTKQIARYTGGNIVINVFRPLDRTYGLEDRVFKIENNSRFQGVGPSIGIDVNWHIGCGFSIFSQINTNILYSKFRNFYKTKISQRITLNTVYFPDKWSFKNDFHLFCSVTKLQIGITKHSYFNEDQNHLGLKLYFDTSYWQKTHYFFYFPSGSEDLYPKTLRNGYDTGLVGFGLDIRLDF